MIVDWWRGRSAGVPGVRDALGGSWLVGIAGTRDAAGDPETGERDGSAGDGIEDPVVRGEDDGEEHQHRHF